MTSTHSRISRSKRIDAAITAGTIGVYFCSSLLCANLDGAHWFDVWCFDLVDFESTGALRILGGILMVVTAVALLFVLPNIYVLKWIRDRGSTLKCAWLYSVTANTAMLFAVCMLQRLLEMPGRQSFILFWSGYLASLVAVSARGCREAVDKSRLDRNWMTFACVLIAALSVVFYPEHLLQCLNEDGTESFALAQSLESHAIPHWVIESWSRGEFVYGPVIVNPSLINSYWTYGFLQLLGTPEVSIRVPFWCWLGLLTFACSALLPESAVHRRLGWLAPASPECSYDRNAHILRWI